MEQLLLSALEDAIDIGIPPLNACIVRGRRPGYRLTEDSGDGARRHFYTSVFFSIHSGSHSELPYVVDWEGTRRERPESTTPPLEGTERLRLTQQYLRPRVLDCVVVDMTDKLKAMEPYEEEISDISLKVQLLKPLSKPSFLELYTKLEITGNDIKSKMSDTNVSGGFPFVILRTGWDRYYDEGQITHPRLESWHLYLTHPYLSESAAQVLLENNAPGVGSDTVGLESPLFNFVSSSTVQESIPSALVRQIQGRPRTLHNMFFRNATPDRPRYILKNLDLRGLGANAGKGNVHGKLVIAPLRLSYPENPQTRIDDAVPASVYFIPFKK